MTLPSGIYTITNARWHNRAYVQNDDDREHVCGKICPEDITEAEQWKLTLHPPGRYTIENVRFRRYAYSTFSSQSGYPIYSAKERGWWKISEIASDECKENIFSIHELDADLSWALYNEADTTPIELGSTSKTDTRVLWKIEPYNTNSSIIQSPKNGSPDAESNRDIPGKPATSQDGPSVSTDTTAPQKVPDVLQESTCSQDDSGKAKAEEAKVKGNVAYKANRYEEAADLYGKAIDMNPSEPTFFMNRAAAYMSMKQLKAALADCRQAAALQHPSPSPKTLLRLARCELLTGLTESALSTIQLILDIDGSDATALSLQKRVRKIDTIMADFRDARSRADWSAAIVALDRAILALETEGGVIPIEWRSKQVLLEVRCGRWKSARMAASNLVGAYHNSPEALTVQGLVQFLIADLSRALYSVQLALKIDPGFVPAQRLHQRIECVQQLQYEGNLACHNQRWGYALRMYEYALEHIGNHDEEAKGGQIRAIFLSLRAYALVKRDHFQEALYDIDISARLYPGYPEAYALRESILCTPAGLADFDTVLEAASQMFPFDIDYDARDTIYTPDL